MIKYTKLNNVTVSNLPPVLKGKTIIFVDCHYTPVKHHEFLPTFPICFEVKNLFYIDCGQLFINDEIYDKKKFPVLERVFIANKKDIIVPYINDKSNIKFVIGSVIGSNIKLSNQINISIVSDQYLRDIIKTLDIFTRE